MSPGKNGNPHTGDPPPPRRRLLAVVERTPREAVAVKFNGEADPPRTWPFDQWPWHCGGTHYAMHCPYSPSNHQPIDVELGDYLIGDQTTGEVRPVCSGDFRQQFKNRGAK